MVNLFLHLTNAYSTENSNTIFFLLFILQPITTTCLHSQSRHALNLPLATVSIEQNVGKILVESW